jgi:hypothetical protein
VRRAAKGLKSDVPVLANPHVPVLLSVLQLAASVRLENRIQFRESSKPTRRRIGRVGFHFCFAANQQWGLPQEEF